MYDRSLLPPTFFSVENTDWFKADFYFRAGFEQSIAVKYSFGVNITLLQHCYVQTERLLYSTFDFGRHLWIKGNEK